MNFYGLETERMQLVCDWARPFDFYLKELAAELNLTAIRLPFSYEYLQRGDFTQMNKIIEYCDNANISVILDYHRTKSDHQGPTPEEYFNRTTFLWSWHTILEYYKDVPAVQGVGIFNEVQGSDLLYVLDLHRDAIDYIEARFPGRFWYFAGCPGWSGNCAGMGALKTHPAWDRIFIEIHMYPFSGAQDNHTWDFSIPEGIDNSHWLVGETGWKDEQSEWADRWLTYLQGRNISNICLWTIAHSWDTNGWWADDCVTKDTSKFNKMKKFWNTQ